MTAKPTEGNIITVQDLIDMMVYYLMPVEPKYLTKIIEETKFIIDSIIGLYLSSLKKPSASL